MVNPLNLYERLPKFRLFSGGTAAKEREAKKRKAAQMNRLKNTPVTLQCTVKRLDGSRCKEDITVPKSCEMCGDYLGLPKPKGFVVNMGPDEKMITCEACRRIVSKVETVLRRFYRIPNHIPLYFIETPGTSMQPKPKSIGPFMNGGVPGMAYGNPGMTHGFPGGMAYGMPAVRYY